MTMTDPIADMLTRIRNANQARLATVQIPSSKIKINIAKVLKEEGFITDYTVEEDNKQGILTVTMKYDGKGVVITGLQRVSRPGRRVYVDRKGIPKVRKGLAIAILSTSKGIMVDKEARKLGVGGEVICSVW